MKKVLDDSLILEKNDNFKSKNSKYTSLEIDNSGNPHKIANVSGTKPKIKKRTPFALETHKDIESLILSAEIYLSSNTIPQQTENDQLIRMMNHQSKFQNALATISLQFSNTLGDTLDDLTQNPKVLPIYRSSYARDKEIEMRQQSGANISGDFIQHTSSFYPETKFNPR